MSGRTDERRRGRDAGGKPIRGGRAARTSCPRGIALGAGRTSPRSPAIPRASRGTAAWTPSWTSSSSTPSRSPSPGWSPSSPSSSRERRAVSRSRADFFSLGSPRVERRAFGRDGRAPCDRTRARNQGSSRRRARARAIDARSGVRARGATRARGLECRRAPRARFKYPASDERRSSLDRARRGRAGSSVLRDVRSHVFKGNFLRSTHVLLRFSPRNRATFTGQMTRRGGRRAARCRARRATGDSSATPRRVRRTRRPRDRRIRVARARLARVNARTSREPAGVSFLLSATRGRGGGLQRIRRSARGRSRSDGDHHERRRVPRRRRGEV